MSDVMADQITVEQVIKALRQRKNPGPAKIDAVRKALPAPIRPTEPALLEIIRGGIRDGQLWEYFPKGDEPHYWPESPEERARTVIYLLLQAKDRTEAELKKKLAANEFSTLSPDALLSQLVAEEIIHRRPAGKSLTYSLKPIDVQAVTAAAWQQVEQLLTADDVTETKLKSLLKKPLQGVLDPEEFLLGLLADGKIHRLPKPGGTKRYALGPVDYRSLGEVFTKPVNEFITKLRRLAEKNGLPDEIAFELVTAQFQEQTIKKTAAVPAATNSNDDSLQQRIIKAMHDLNPRVADGDLVAIPELRQRLSGPDFSKPLFDRLLLELYRSRKVVLSRISSAFIAEHDRDKYVVDEDGVYYNTVALWKE